MDGSAAATYDGAAGSPGGGGGGGGAVEEDVKRWGEDGGGGGGGWSGPADGDDTPVPQTAAACGIAGCRNPKVNCSGSPEARGSPTSCGHCQPTSASNTGNDGDGKWTHVLQNEP